MAMEYSQHADNMISRQRFLLEAEVTRKAGFGHDVVGRLQRDAIGHDGVRGMRDVGTKLVMSAGSDRVRVP